MGTDAKELDAIYEPLWAAVPETRPSNMWLETRYGATEFLFRHRDDNGAEWTERMPPVAAAALCRVAALKWLVSHDTPSTDYYSDGQMLRFQDGAYAAAEERDADLVAACLAVANATPHTPGSTHTDSTSPR